MIAACRRLYGAIAALDDAVARRAGLSLNDLRALNLLEAGPTTPRAVAEALGLTSGAVTGLLDRLEAAGLVARRPHPTDRRSVEVVGTERMFAELGPPYRAVAQALSALAEAYPPEEAEAAIRHLTDAAAAYEAATARLR